LTRVLLDPTGRDFFYPKGKKLKHLRFLGGDGRLEQNIDPTGPE